MKGPLTGARVVDLSRAIAGPYGSMILGDLGADVIKIESPEGEVSRATGGSEADYKGQSYYFMAFNRNKRSLTLDLSTTSGRQVVHDLVAVSDVVWDNFRPGVMERLRLDHETLKKINPRIISCSVTGFGSSGPHRDRKSFDLVSLAMSGAMSITGEPGGPPLRPGPPYGDLVGGMFGAMGVMAALFERERTGVGQRVEANLLDGQISNMAYHISYYLYSGKVPQPMGGSHLSFAPYGVFNTKEGYIVIGPSWPRIARVLGLEWMIEDPRFKELGDRVANKKELDALLQGVLMQERAADWLALFQAEDIASAPVLPVDKALEDPQIANDNMIVSMPHPLGGEIKLAGNPIKMPESIVEDYAAPPLLGQHNDDILAGLLNYPPGRIRELREEQARNREALIARLDKAR